MKQTDEIFEEEPERPSSNYRHSKIKRSKESNRQREQTLKQEKRIKSEAKKNFLMQDKILRNKIENEKNKERLYNLSPCENFFVSLMKKITCIRENKMIYQIYILYIFLFIIFIIIIVYIKYNLLYDTFNDFVKQNYFPYIEKEMIKCQNALKSKSDEKNNKNMISALDEQMLFMEIYSKELINNDILEKDNIKFKNNDNNNENSKSYDHYLGKNYEITSKLNTLIQSNADNNLRNLIIYYYNFVPILSQYLESLGLKIINFYFIGNTPNCTNETINNLFFKYPLEINYYGLDIHPSNDKINDYVIDPYIACNNGYESLDKEELIKIIEQNNWYYKLYNEIGEKEINFRFFHIMKMNQVNQREDYYISYDKFNFNGINFLFGIRLAKSDIEYPFIKFNVYEDTLFYDFLSIYNFNNDDIEISSMNNIWENIDNIFHNDYDIDNGKNIIFKNPKFVENMEYFILQNNNKDIINDNYNENNRRILKIENQDLKSKIPVDNIIMVKYNEINDIDSRYRFNYYYEADVMYYKLIYFFNQFLQYKKYYPNFLTSNSGLEESETQREESKKDYIVPNPCSINNLDDYYNTIKSKFNYDCINDYCFFHNCEPNDSLYKKKNFYNLPNCYCIPLYCKDNSTQKNSEFEKKIRDEFGINYDDDSFDISFTSNYDYFKNELETPFSKLNNYFDRSEFNFKCHITFNKKNLENNKTFFAKIYETEYNQDNIFLMYLYNLENMKNIVSALKSDNTKFIKKLIITYIIFCIGLGIVIFIYVHFLCNKLITKMNKVKNMRKSIISNANNNSSENTNENNIENKKIKEINLNNKIQNDSDKFSFENNQKNNIKINIKNNENDILLKESEDSNKNKDKNNTDELNNNNQEEDELDELIKLIKSNLSVFKIEFNLNEESHDNLSSIKKQYEEIMQVNKFKNKLFLKEKSPNFNLINDNNISINSNSTTEKNGGINKKQKIEDLSVNVLCELLSLSNPKIDFSCIKTNFYFRENKDNSLYRLKNILENMNEGNNVENIDIINIEKLQNALEHYTENVHNYWKNYYEFQKNKDEI